MPEEMNTNNSGGMNEQAPEQALKPKQGRSGKIVAIVAIVLIIAGAVYAWSRKGPEKEEANEPAVEQGAAMDQSAPVAGNVPETTATSSTADMVATATTTAGEQASPSSVPPATSGQNRETPKETTVVVTHGDSGYSPQAVTIKKGSTLTFKNESGNQSWPASAMHPTHTAYPGSDITKCGTADESTIFDACRGLNKGEQWFFKFDNAGSWKYHDHLEPGHNGTIVVTE